MTSPPIAPCEGPLVWFDTTDRAGLPAAVLECARCGWVVVTGNFYDDAHRAAPILREGLASR